jgi:hypothetical protein
MLYCQLNTNTSFFILLLSTLSLTPSQGRRQSQRHFHHHSVAIHDHPNNAYSHKTASSSVASRLRREVKSVLHRHCSSTDDTSLASTSISTSTSTAHCNYNNVMNQLEREAITDYFLPSSLMNSYEENEDEIPFSFNANIEEAMMVPETTTTAATETASTASGIAPFRNRPAFHKVVQNAMNQCYQTSSPGAMYDDISSTSTCTSTLSATTCTATTTPTSSIINMNMSTSSRRRSSIMNHNDDDTKSSSNEMKFVSLLKRRKRKKEQSKTGTVVSPPSSEESTTTEVDEEQEEFLKEPSPAILSGIIKPLIPKSIWNSLTGKEFYYPSTLSNLIQTGIQMACGTIDDNECQIDWKPANSKTKKVLANNKSTDGNYNDDNNKQSIIEALVNENQVLVWIGNFITNKKDEGYGAGLPLIKTISIVPLSPKAFAELLMDSNQVQSYVKMSLVRKDVLIFQHGVDTKAGGDANANVGRGGGSGSGNGDGSSFALDGEAKIVRNVTKPPLSKKLMDFVTLMYARRLDAEDDISAGYLGGGAVNDDDSDSNSYIVVTRAVGGGQWNSGSDDEEEEMIRSEILLGVNLLRSIPGEPDKTELTAVTHVYLPSVPLMLAGTVGVKNAIDFIKDIRALCQQES